MSGRKAAHLRGHQCHKSNACVCGYAEALSRLPAKSAMHQGHYRQIAIHVHEPARQRARERATIPAFAAAQRQRRKVEALFAELKNQIGLRRVRLRRMKHVREQFFLAATAQNLKRLARFLRSRSVESATVPI